MMRGSGGVDAFSLRLVLVALLLAVAQAHPFSSAANHFTERLRWAYHSQKARLSHATCVRKALHGHHTGDVQEETKLDGRQDSPAPNCQSLECPPYKLVHEESDFQIRRYRSATWIETQPLEDVSFMKATYRGFHSLFQYIEGENFNETHVPMTAPVVTSIVPSAGPFCSSAFVVRLYVPSKYAKETPEPKDTLRPRLSVASSGDRCVAVRKFGGFASDFNVASEASLLAASLERTPWKDVVEGEISAGEDAYSIAQYNSPFEFSKRVNEVWVNIPVDKKDVDKCLPVAKAKANKKVLGIFSV